MEKLISVIIPVHNVQNYIRKCLDSVIHQTYSDLEIILINDSSTDDSEKICKEYCLKDNRVKLFNHNSKSAGFSRNYGLEKANGEYVIFVDADDYIEATMCEKLYATIRENESDVCFCGYNKVTETTEERVFLNGSKIQNYNREEIRNDIIYNTIYVSNNKNKLLLYAVWNGMYDLNLIKEHLITFTNENEYFSEDSIFNYEYLMKCNKATIINDNLYNHTFYNKNSICNIYNERYNCLDNWYYYLLERATEENKEKVKKVVQQRYINFTLLRIKQEILLSNKSVIEIIKKIREIINNKITREAIKEVNVKDKSKKQKIFILLIKYRLSILIYLLINLRKK